MRKIKTKDSFPSIYFGFLSAFAMIIVFFMFRALMRVVISNIYATFISLIIYILVLYSSFYYSEHDKNLRKSVIYSTTILWVAYLIAIILTYII